VLVIVSPMSEKGFAVYWRLDQPRPYRISSRTGGFGYPAVAKKGKDLYLSTGTRTIAFAGNPPGWKFVLVNGEGPPAFTIGLSHYGRRLIAPRPFSPFSGDTIAEVLYPSEVVPPYHPFLTDELMMYYPWDLLAVSPRSGEVLYEDPKEFVLRWDVGGMLKPSTFTVILNGKELEKPAWDEKTGLLRVPFKGALKYGTHTLRAIVTTEQGKHSDLAMMFQRSHPPKSLVASCDHVNCASIWVEFDKPVNLSRLRDVSLWKVVSAQGEVIPVVVVETRQSRIGGPLPGPGLPGYAEEGEGAAHAVMVTLKKRLIGRAFSKHRLSFQLTPAKSVAASITFPF
jgi:hypothetical protein